jgi:hypothetical protein
VRVEVAAVMSMDPATMEAEARAARVTAPVDPWLTRRLLGFGASEVGALLLALDLASLEERAAAPKYMLDDARVLIRRKAGLTRGGKAGRAAERGAEAERHVLAAWACPVRSQLVSVTHADAAPRSWYPLVDRECPRLTATPDAWGVDLFGDDVGIEVKATVHRREVTPWYWLAQVHAQMAVCGYPWSALVIGEGWAHHDARGRQSPVAVYVERDEAWIARIRSAVVAGWFRVVQAKGNADE